MTQLSLSIEEVRAATGLGRTKLYQLINSGELKARKLTTFTSYGTLDPYRQGEVIRGLSEQEREEDKLEKILTLLQSGA